MSPAADTAWITVVGLGEDGIAALSDEARAAIARAELLIGGERHLALVGGQAPACERMTWRTPLKDTMADIAARRGRRVVVLATGDPMWFGVGVTLAKHFRAEELRILPVAGAFSLAAARLGWSLADTVTLTLHGRRLTLLNAHVAPGVRLLIMAEDGATPAQVAALLTRRGYGDSAMTVLEHLGGPAERCVTGNATTWPQTRTADLNTIAVECVAGTDAALLADAPGLPDDAFRHDGQITKREVRAVTVAALMPLPGRVLWDVGAGCGSVAIEWLRAARDGVAYAIEHMPERARFIAHNAAELGTPGLRLVEGRAPAALDGLPPPDAVFIGGGLGEAGLWEMCWQRLKPGGRIVANAVTVEGEAGLFRLRDALGGTLTRLAISRAEKLGPLLAWRPLMPVTQWAARKA